MEFVEGTRWALKLWLEDGLEQFERFAAVEVFVRHFFCRTGVGRPWHDRAGAFCFDRFADFLRCGKGRELRVSRFFFFGLRCDGRRLGRRVGEDRGRGTHEEQEREHRNPASATRDYCPD